jgi:NAD(P)-dependent dehydrogenase (short-subunit alcohol dehydrogenase family)
MIRAILPFMREQNYGRIINFSSVLAQKGVAGTSAYAASKAALWGMSKSIAAENAGKNITINCLNLGYFNLGMIEQVPEELQNELKKSIPTGDFGDPENIYKAVRFLIESNYVNGSSIDINGGLF